MTSFDRIRHLSQIQKLDPVAFEHFVAHMFERMGYDVEVKGQTGDRGRDRFILIAKGKLPMPAPYANSLQSHLDVETNSP